MASGKKATRKSAKGAPAKVKAQPARPIAKGFEQLLAELARAIKERHYAEAERLGNELLDQSPSEEADRCIHEIISSATTIRDAEDEIVYQLEDLKAALEDQPLSRETEVDGL